jgi:pimeloyl-ACP methyl ester carboxylesterase
MVRGSPPIAGPAFAISLRPRPPCRHSAVAISRQARRRVAPTPDPRLAKITIKGLVDHFEKQIRDLPEQPVLIGHSFGGLIVQMLLDRGLGAAGVAIDEPMTVLDIEIIMWHRPPPIEPMLNTRKSYAMRRQRTPMQNF